MSIGVLVEVEQDELCDSVKREKRITLTSAVLCKVLKKNASAPHNDRMEIEPCILPGVKPLS